MVLTENLKKILLAGIGTIATTAEKSKEILDDMVKKGELTVEQGKILNSELSQNIKDTIKNRSIKIPKSAEGFKDLIRSLTPDQLKELKRSIEKADAEVEADVEAKVDEVVSEVEETVSEIVEDEEA